jgi:5-methylthioribose kinase
MSEAQSLDIENADSLIAYLRSSGRVNTAEMPRICVLAGGVSNKTVLVERASGEAWVLKQALAKLRTQADWFSDPARVHREADGLRWLPKFAPPGSITPLVFEDPSHCLLAMAAVPQPHENWKSMLLAGRIEDDHVIQFGRLLGEIHHRSAAARGEVEPVFADRSFFQSLRLEPYYTYTATQVPAAANFLEDLIDSTRARRLTLVHGDYSPKNVLIHEGRVILLDHEVIHFGDPAFDLGFALTHFLSKANHRPAQRGRFADAALLFWETYQRTISTASWRNGLDSHAVRHTLGCLLARVAGRSPLEYLQSDARGRQKHAVLELMTPTPVKVPELVMSFVDCVT